MEQELYEVDDKAQRRRIIIITVAIAVIVLGIAAWAIIAIVSGSQTGVVNQTNQVAVDDGSANSAVIEETAKDAPVSEGVSTENKAAETETAKETNKKEASTSSDNNSNKTSVAPKAQSTVPNTGPEDVLPLALIIGAATAFIASRVMAKADR